MADTGGPRVVTASWSVAVALIVLVSLAHSYLGERYILIRLFKRDLPKLLGGVEFTRGTLRFAWHLTSVAWIALGAVLFAVARAEEGVRTSVGRILAVTFLIHGLVALLGSRGRHLSWIVFFAISGLVFFG
ncbi:MAG: hypothetical protein ABI672_04285 [Vicinamibacteria bacterium]